MAAYKKQMKEQVEKPLKAVKPGTKEFSCAGTTFCVEEKFEYIK